MLTGKTICVGVTGGIACYKACEVVSRLVKLHATVKVVMTAHATEFVRPLTFESLSGNAVATDMFAEKRTYDIEHISLAKGSDAFVIVPATANIIGKVANGIADDLLSTTLLATKKPIIFAPAMNSGMYTSDAFQANLEIVKSRGSIIVEPAVGRLACGDTGVGKLADVDLIVNTIVSTVMPEQLLKGKTVLVTAGATVEKLDGVRYITNYSSGKMGIAIATAAREYGAKVILVLGRHTATVPNNMEVLNVQTTEEMFTAVMDNLERSDVIIKSAAPCDFRPVSVSPTKIKAKELTVHFVANKDIACEVGKIKGDKKLIIFSAETDNLIANAKGKLLKKNADMVVANDVTVEGAGFNVDTNVVTFIHRDGQMRALPLMDKKAIAVELIKEISKL